MSDMRRRAMMGSVDRMLGTLDDMDAERLKSRKDGLQDGTAEGEDRPQLPDEDSRAMDMGGFKGSDSDLDTEGLWQMKSAPHDQEQDPEPGADMGKDGEDASTDDDWKELRDAAARGDVNARKILEVIDEVDDGEGTAGGDTQEENAALDKSDADAEITSQTDTTDRETGMDWSEKEPVQDGSGMYDRAKAKRGRR